VRRELDRRSGDMRRQTAEPVADASFLWLFTDLSTAV
jgi:hypothetical protein